MTITGTIEQAPQNAYLFSDSMTGDLVFRSITSNNFMFGFNSNRPSSFSIQPVGTVVNADPGTYATANLFLNSSGTSNAALQTGNIIGSLCFSGNYASSSTFNSNVMASIATVYTGTGTTKGGDITFNTDCNAGLTERMRITASGNVGIGTGVPPSKVSLYSASNNIDISIGNSNSSAQIGYVGRSGSYAVGTVANDLVIKNNYGAIYVQNGSNSPGGISVGSNNKVGINTRLPNYTLDVVGDINFTGTLRQGGSSYAQSLSNVTATSIKTGTLYTTGNLGVCNSNPSYALDVIGDLNFTGALRQGGHIQSFQRYDQQSHDDLVAGRTNEHQYGRVHPDACQRIGLQQYSILVHDK